MKETYTVIYTDDELKKMIKYIAKFSNNALDEYLPDGRYDLPALVCIRPAKVGISVHHQNASKGYQYDFDILKKSDLYKNWYDNSVPVDVIISPKDYPEYQL